MPLKVLLATPYDLAVPGGANRQPFGLLAALDPGEVEARLVGPSSGAPAVQDPRVIPLGAVARLPLNGAASRITLDLGTLPSLRRLVAEFDPDVVHVQEPVVPLPGAALLWIGPRRALRVGTFHTFSERSLGYLAAWPWVRAIWSRLHVRVAVSEAAREFATRYHRADFRIIPNAVDIPEAASPPQRSEGPLRVLFVGRLAEPRKGFGHLLGALRRLQESAPGRLAVTAVGRGEAAWLEAAAGLPVRFAGEVDDAGLAAAYAAADLVVVPSQGGESFGLVPLEAMAHQRPVLATRIAGYEAWMEGAARLVPPADEPALAEALGALAGDFEARRDLAARGARRARDHAWSTLAEEWVRVYRQSPT